MKYEITKGSEKDFEQAPEWATKVLRDNNDSKKSFVGELGGITLVAEAVSSHSWWKYNDGYVGSLIAERRPITEPVWDGEGLPPVGVECEGLFPRHPGNSFEWQDCLVLYVFEHECAVKSKVTSTLHYCDQFRPIRSPEDVARDEAIDAIFSILSVNILDGSDSNAGKVFDAIAAGKIPGVKLE